MDQDNNHPQDVRDSPYAWMRHASWNNPAVDDFPTASAPIIYEGFIPQHSQHFVENQSGHNTHAFQINHYPSQYPPINQDDLQHHTGGPVQPLYQPLISPFTSNTSSTYPPLEGLQNIHQSVEDDYISTDNDNGNDNDEDMSMSEVDGGADTDIAPGRGRGRGRGRPRGRGRGSGRVGRPKRREKQRGGWNRGTKTGLRAVLDPGEEFNTLHKDATEAFIDQQDYDKALELILRAISINPEIYSAHVLLSEIYFAKKDDERGVAALFSGAHASPNDPAVWHQLADVCLQQSSLDRFTMLKQASYCFQRLLQIDRQDHDARFQKAAISRELGHHAKALKDLDHLLLRMPHNSSILRQIAEVCLDINDVGKAIGLYDDALEYQQLNGANDEESFGWADLIVYVDLIARPNGILKGIQVLKSIARRLLGREDETFWDDHIEDDREWDAEHTPRRIEVLKFKSDHHPLEKYGIGLPLELRIKLGDFRLKSGNREEAKAHFEWLVPEDHEEGAPIYEYMDLFLQVADALREVKDFEQALRYYEALYSVEACDDVDFWLGLGACSYICEKKDQAFRCYEAALDGDPMSGEARTQLSKLHAEKGERERALVLARSAIAIYESQLPKTERRKYERKDMREAREAAQKAYKDAFKIPKPQDERDDLPKPYFSRRAREKARRLAKEAAAQAAAGEEDQEAMADSEQRPRSVTPPVRQDGLRSREEAIKQMKKNRRSKKNRTVQDRYDTIQQLYRTMSGVTGAMREGDDIARNVWMDCAETLVEEFRKEKVFYPAERYVKFTGFDRPHQKSRQWDSDGASQQAQEDLAMPSVESNIPNDYCGIVFTNWLDVFLEYALLLANFQEDNTDCYTVIRAALDCNVWYHDEEAIFQIYTCWLVCTIALRDEITLFNTVVRWFMREYTFCTDTFRLFEAMNYYFPLPNDKAGKIGQMNSAVFRSAPNQKYFFRQIMAVDCSLPEEYGVDQPDGPVPEFMRKSNNEIQYLPHRTQQASASGDFGAQSNTADMGNDPTSTPLSPTAGDDQQAYRMFQPKELDLVLLVLYAQILYAGGSFPNALSYFYRAYTLDPKNSMVLFSIALCYMHQLLKRQNENRHMYLLQAWSFFEEYADARLSWAETKQREGWNGLVVTVEREIEFNRARCWQMLGMSDLAIRSYGKMLDMGIVKAEDEMTMDGNGEYKDIFSKEAAFAMVGMYAVYGDMDRARQITEQYLVVE